MSEDHFAFVLHDLRFENAQIVPLTKRVVQFLAEQGTYCQYLCVSPLDKRELKKSYSKILSHLDKYHQLDQAIRCTVGCFDHTSYRVDDYNFNTYCGLSNGDENPEYQNNISITQPTFYLYIIQETYRNMNQTALFQFLHQLIIELRPRYGYWTLTDSAFGYFERATSHIPDSDEKQRGYEWYMAPYYQAWNQSYIRNVYPGNYLNEEQLEQHVTDQTLGEWIAADSTRGTLTQMTPDLWYWQIAPVRAMLDAAQITFKREYVTPKRQHIGPPLTQSDTLQLLLDKGLIDADALVVCVDPETRQQLAKMHSLAEVENIAFTPLEIIRAANELKNKKH